MANTGDWRLGVYPHTGCTRRLADLPLTADDWHRVWLAHQGFITQIRLIVSDVQERERRQQELEAREAEFNGLEMTP